MQILFLKLVVDRQTYQLTDIVTYRAAIAGNNITITNTNTATTVTTTTKTTMASNCAYYILKTRCGPTNGPTYIATYRAAIAAKNYIAQTYSLQQQYFTLAS